MSIPRPKFLLRELATAAVVALVAAIVGYGLGIVLNRAFGISKPDSSPTRSAAAVTPAGTTTAAATTTSTTTTAATTTATATTAATTTAAATPAPTAGAGIDLGDGLTFSASQAELVNATKPSGIAANAARLAVQATIRNTGSTTVTPEIDRLFIRYAGEPVRVDQNAFSVAGGLVRPIAPGATARGELRFEARGAVTEAMKDLTEAIIRLGPQKITVRLG